MAGEIGKQCGFNSFKIGQCGAWRPQAWGNSCIQIIQGEIKKKVLCTVSSHSCLSELVGLAVVVLYFPPPQTSRIPSQAWPPHYPAQHRPASTHLQPSSALQHYGKVCRARAVRIRFTLSTSHHSLSTSPCWPSSSSLPLPGASPALRRTQPSSSPTGTKLLVRPLLSSPFTCVLCRLCVLRFYSPDLLTIVFLTPRHARKEALAGAEDAYVPLSAVSYCRCFCCLFRRSYLTKEWHLLFSFQLLKNFACASRVSSYPFSNPSVLLYFFVLTFGTSDGLWAHTETKNDKVPPVEGGGGPVDVEGFPVGF